MSERDSYKALGVVFRENTGGLSGRLLAFLCAGTPPYTCIIMDLLSCVS